MTTVRQLLDDKGCAFWSTEPSRSIDEAIATMAERDIGALLVIDDRSGNLLGIITERRCARLAQNGKTTANGRVRDFVDPAIPTVGLSDSIESCLTRLTETRARYLAVLCHGRPIGVLALDDLLKTIIRDQQYTIRALESYIHGRPAAW